MRAVLQAIAEELARLKAEGEHVVPVTEEALAGLRALVAERGELAVAEPAGASGAGSGAGERGSVPLGRAGRRLEGGRAVSPGRASAPALPPPPTVTLPEGGKEARWAALLEMVGSHPVCLANVRPGKKVVLGTGALDARIFFVGDAPGPEEEIAGEHFVGPAGELLAKMIGGMGLNRDKVFIGNLLSWRPLMPVAEGQAQMGHRAPTVEEMAFGLPFLRAAIEVVQPELLVALGGASAQGLLGERFTTLPEARGKWHEFAGRPLMVTYHPNYLLRNGSNKSKRAVWEDLLQVMERGGLPISAKQRGYFL